MYKLKIRPKKEEVVKIEEQGRQSVYILLIASDASASPRIDKNYVFRFVCVFSNIGGRVVDIVVVGFDYSRESWFVEQSSSELCSASVTSIWFQTPFL